ncbi:MAG: hypothetical protein AAGA23_18180 [Pseudomonadota bacterium]
MTFFEPPPAKPTPSPIRAPLLQRLRSPAVVVVLGLIAVCTATLALLLRIPLGDSALLYVGVPYLVAVTLLVFSHSPRKQGLRHTYRWFLGNSLAVFIASAVLLREGFICVLFFLPIYALIVSLVFGLAALVQAAATRQRRLRVSLLPLLLLLSSVEGVVPELTLPSHYRVTVTDTVDRTPAEIRQRLANPPAIGASRNLLLHLFPMPYAVEAGSLRAGAEHRAHYRYHRWFVTNTHEGTSTFRVVHSDDHSIAIKTVSDTSYLAGYLRILRAEAAFRPTGQRTEVTLTIDFERKLSPAWYFGPLQKRAVGLMAQHLITEMMNHG